MSNLPETQANPLTDFVGSEGVELTKDGNVSRMRSHKGNTPSLPQNKFCPMCPAKFTRTTHLNRHLRTHSNERMHECDKCHAQFTRSDLLSRHKKNCGDSPDSHRSRRKSCQACADSKIKCDQQRPCSKCKTRGRECVYRTTPNSKSTNGRSTRNALDRKESGDSSSQSPPLSTPESGGPIASSSTPTIVTSPVSNFPLSGQPINISFDAKSQSQSSAYLPPLTEDLSNVSSYATSSAASNYSTEVETPHVSFAQEAFEVQNQLNALFSNEMFDKFFNNAMAPELGSGSGVVHNTSNARGEESFNLQVQDTEFPWSTNAEESQPFMASIDPYDFEAFMALQSGGLDASPPAGTANMGPSLDGPAGTLKTNAPHPAELQYYLHMFYTKFLEQMPILHVPTFNPEVKTPILVSAMQACGALYVKTPSAFNFITSTLASARDEIVAAFSRRPTIEDEQIQLVMAVCLLQTIGLFHQRPEQRAQSNMYHAMLVMMIRQSGLLEKNFSWEPLPLTDQASSEAAWRNWVCYETAKRALSLTFLHDCCHCIYFTLRPTFFPSEFNLRLPCEDSLWKATSYEEWHIALLKPSPYGTARDRLRGALPIQNALSTLAEMPPTPRPALILNPFSQFIIIHAILRKLFEDCLDKQPIVERSPSDDMTNINPTIQFMLHNWLQSWFQSPETPRPSKLAEPPFFHDALPFYWIAQVLLLAYQEGLPPFVSDTAGFNTTSEAKFSLMKEWFKHIRGFLRSGEQGPTLFWDELMKIRMQSWQTASANGNPAGDGDGLLGFFLKQ
ncbi:unnamed protein product [Somion occarium]